MKNHLFILVLSCLFLLGSASYSHAQGGGAQVLIILNVKTVSPLYSLVIPDKYVNKDKSLKFPLEIILKGDSNSPVITLQSTSLYITLPSALSGTYLMEVRVGDFVLIKDVFF